VLIKTTVNRLFDFLFSSLKTTDPNFEAADKRRISLFYQALAAVSGAAWRLALQR